MSEYKDAVKMPKELLDILSKTMEKQKDWEGVASWVLWLLYARGWKTLAYSQPPGLGMGLKYLSLQLWLISPLLQ